MKLKLETDDADKRVSESLFPRVTKEGIESQIKIARYLNDEHLTICIIHMKNGFFVIGQSAPADPRNFDADVGRRYAYDDAFRKIWQLEGYRLRCTLDTKTPNLKVINE